MVLAQRVDGETHWSPDYQAFKRYIFSIQTDHQPQYNQIMNGQPVTWPDYAKALPGDSLLLEEVSTLSKTCGVGFSYFMRSEGKRDSVVTNGGCNDEIVAKFDTLRKHFIEQHPMRYYVLIPLNNVKKALFKNGLYKPSSKSASIIAFVLFTYRTILLVLGIISLVIMFKKRESLQGLALLVGSYFVIWYFFNSAVYKNMEIRYLLQADVLMLIPLSWLIVFIFNKYSP